MDNNNNLQQESMLRVGTILRGIYRIDSYLSSGGFGNTYVATNIEFNERYAIKEFFMKGVTQRDGDSSTVSVSNSINQDSFLQQKEKFKKEARRIRQLKNEHIVNVHDLFEENGTAYYVMDYIDGESLAARMKRTGNPMTEDEVNNILPQILDALKVIHDNGIWHLDLKPANIMIDKAGNVKLIDFGASKQLNAQKGGATTSTAISYTNGYAPREQMEQNYDKFGPWTDLYALGATLYNLLTNQRPPLPTDIDDDMSDDKHLALPMPNLSSKMKRLILWLMKTNRTLRPKSIEEIEQFLNNKKSEQDLVPAEPNPNPKSIPALSSNASEETVIGESDGIIEEKEKPHYTDYDWPEDNTGWFVGISNLSGRWRRREFAVGFALIFLISFFFLSWILTPVYGAISVKRLKDIGWPPYLGWVSALSYFICYCLGVSEQVDFFTISIIVFAAWGLLLCLYPGSKGINEYGSDPRRDYEEQCEEIGLPKVSECIY